VGRGGRPLTRESGKACCCLPRPPVAGRSFLLLCLHRDEGPCLVCSSSSEARGLVEPAQNLLF
jgi:hypothetical protein